MIFFFSKVKDTSVGYINISAEQKSHWNYWMLAQRARNYCSFLTSEPRKEITCTFIFLKFVDFNCAIGNKEKISPINLYSNQIKNKKHFYIYFIYFLWWILALHKWKGNVQKFRAYYTKIKKQPWNQWENVESMGTM